MLIRGRLFEFEATRDGVFVGFGVEKRRPYRGGGLEQRRWWQAHWSRQLGQLIIN